LPREVPLAEAGHPPAIEIQETKQAQVPVAPPKQKRQISTAWTNEEHQILYDLIATGEVTNFELIQELLPSKTITNIKFKVGELRRMYRDELKIQQEMASLMNIRAATTQRRRVTAGVGGQMYAPDVV
jgi:serine phosphatase RsbU (regulator of sigma subunit)